MTTDGELVSTRAFSVAEKACLDAASATVTDDATRAATHAATIMKRLVMIDPLESANASLGEPTSPQGRSHPKVRAIVRSRAASARTRRAGTALPASRPPCSRDRTPRTAERA